jgi:serine/threonine protein kinase/Tol biopolymer transport system component
MKPEPAASADLSHFWLGRWIRDYQVLSLIGAGGMGEVYRAKDTKLDREVALKVLPKAFARDPERVARFQREARLLAALNHPNVAAIHGLEESEGRHVLVLELVEGETLAKRIARGPIPIAEALPLFRQLAAGLEAAHEKGIVHRDLKPANVTVTVDGKVKVLDFGLAKAFAGVAPAGSDLATVSAPDSGTGEGRILGTVSYMSPEQTRGQAVDKRTDVWAFGCVLYEALTARRAFSGGTSSDRLAAVLEREVDWGALPDETPLLVRSLLRRCLQKDKDLRLHDVADARIEIEEALADLSRPSGEPIDAVTQRRLERMAAEPARSARRRWALTVGAAVVLAGAAVAAIVWGPWRTPSSREPIVSRFVTTLPPGQTIPNLGSWGSTVALSADGSQLVYVAQEGDTRRLYRRPMESFEAEPIPGTEGALAPFLSPDGSWVGFYSGQEVKKVSLRGGALSTVCTVDRTTFRGGSWGPRDTIAYSQCTYGLRLVPVAGGTPEVLTSVSEIQHEGNHAFPQFLPGGEAVLFTVANSPVDARIAVYNQVTGEQRTLIDPGFYGRYVSTGHIVYAWEGELLAVPFDLDELEVTGLPVRVLDGVLMEGDPRAAHFSISDNGTLVYVPGGILRDESQLVWVDRAGKEEETLSFPPGLYGPRISPDGRQILVSRSDPRGAGSCVWAYELERGVERRVTDETGAEYWPIWTPDARRVVYNSRQGGRSVFRSQPIDGSDPGETIMEKGESWPSPYSFSDDGSLAYQESERLMEAFDVWVLPPDGPPHAFLQTESNEFHPAFSPDGRWIAYVSDESGGWEVNLRPYPGPGAVTRVSMGGGEEPIWSPDGREIYYRGPWGDSVLAVSFDPGGSSPRLGRPRLLFEGRYVNGNWYGRRYDLSPDGERFLLVREGEPPPAQTQYNIVLNWFEELERLVPTD